MQLKKNGKAAWASACSLAFVALTLLMEYRMVLKTFGRFSVFPLVDARMMPK